MKALISEVSDIVIASSIPDLDSMDIFRLRGNRISNKLSIHKDKLSLDMDIWMRTVYCHKLNKVFIWKLLKGYLDQQISEEGQMVQWPKSCEK